MFSAGRWPVIMLLYVYGVLATSIVTQAVPVIGDISKLFDLSRTEAGWIISIPSLVTAVAALFGGWIIDQIGDRRVIFAGCLFAIGGNLVVVTASDTSVLVAGRLLEGIGYLALTVGAVTMIMRTTTGVLRSAALGLWTSHTAVGIGATLIIVAPLAQHGEMWRWAFGAHAGILGVLAILVVLLPATDPNVAVRRIDDILVVVRSIKPYRVAAASCASAFIQTGVMASLVVYLTQTHGVPLQTAASVGTAAEVVNVIGCVLIGPLLKYGHSPSMLALGGGVVLLFSGVVLYLPGVDFPYEVVAVAGFSLSIGVTNGVIWSLVPVATPSVVTMGATSGLVAQGTYLGVLLGPPALFATLYEGGWTVRIALIALATVLQIAPLRIWNGARSELGTSVPRPEVAG